MDTKTELIEALGLNRDELLSVLADLDETEITMPRVVGEWSIKDVVGHIAYWEQVIHDHVRESFAEGRPRPASISETDDAINARESAKRSQWKWQRVRAEFENARRALIERVERLSESELSFVVPSPWRGDERFYSVAEMIEEDAIGHCREHTQQIAHWKQNRAKDA